MKCPACDTHFDSALEIEVAKYKHVTLDCPYCGALLLWKDNQLTDFHKTIHAECEAWPEDGKGTHSLKIGDYE